MVVKPGSVTLEGKAVVSREQKPPHLLRVTIRVRDGLVEEIVPPEGGDLVFDDSHLILPGFIDMHVHCREDSSGLHNYKEDFESAGKAALQGGVVAIADMPNNPVPPESLQTLKEKERLAEKCSVDVLLYALARKGSGPFSESIPYKLYMAEEEGLSDAQLKELFSAFSGHWLSVHAEDYGIIQKNGGLKTHEERRPPEAEVECVKRLLNTLGSNPGVHLHFCHISTGGAVSLIRDAKREGLSVTCEAACHHLFFSYSDFPASPAGFSNVNPPLRSAEDQQAIASALEDGVIDALATDHAPHTSEEKRAGASGFPGLDSYGDFVALLAKSLPMSRVVAVSSGFAASFWKRFSGETFGTIAPGAVGSFAVLGKLPWKGVRKESFASKCGWSPYVGYTFPGTVYATIVRGNVAFRRE